MTAATRKSASRTPYARAARSRRGNVIILVVAVLAVLAIFAASYVTVTRLERASSVAYSERSNFTQQRDAVVSHVQLLLAADLFGKKVVTATTPRRDTQGRPIWPAMFEDGAFFDKPYVVSDPRAPEFSFNAAQPGQNPSPHALLSFDPALNAYQVAYPDDAWLAPNEPVALTPGPGQPWAVWPQISNLRSAYNWDPRQGNAGAWVRDHGRFVDLGNLFRGQRARTQQRGDPGADLTDLSSDPGFSWSLLNAVQAGVLQRVYDKQMGHMQEWVVGTGTIDADDAASYTHADTRMWVDTDGDGRPDARWQELDALGFALGMRWFVASRIVDASAMINVNTSLEFGNPTDTLASAATGLTPADVDLYRLLHAAAFSNDPDFPRHPDMVGYTIGHATSAFTEHMTRGLGLGPRFGDDPGLNPRPYVFDEVGALINDPEPNFVKRWAESLERRSDTGAGWTGADSWNNPINLGLRTFTTRNQREAYYRFVGASPQASPLSFASPYPLTDEIDLRAHFGFNYDQTVSKLEQRFDGPGDAPQYTRLPGITAEYPRAGSLGLLRSQEDLEFARRIEDNTTAGRFPGGLQGNYTQQEKIRRIEADVRRHLTTYSGVAHHSPISPKRRIEPGRPGAGGLAGSSAMRKLRVDGAPAGQTSEAASAFTRRAFESFVWALAPLAGDQPLMRGLLRGLSYADRDFHYGGGATGPAQAIEAGSGLGQINAAYAVMRALALAVNLKDAVDFEDAALGDAPTVVRFHNLDDVGLAALTPGDTAIRLGRSFAHGVIDESLLPQAHVGAPDAGVTMIGLERIPYLREVATFTYYQDETWENGSLTTPEIEPTNILDQLGTIVAIEVGNPWPDEIYLDNYTFRLSDGTNVFDMELDGPIQPGESQILYFTYGYDRDDWFDVRDGWLDAVTTLSALQEPPRGVVGSSIVPNDDEPVFLIPFDGGTAQAMLIYNDFRGTTQQRYIVDRMSSPGDPFPVVLVQDGTIPDPGPGTGPWTGRKAVVSSLRRPTEIPADGGFPAYVVERPSANVVGVVREDLLDDPWKIAAPSDAFAFGADSYTVPVVLEEEIYLGQEDPDLALADLRAFQLFVPDGPLLAASELHMICKFAHTYRNPDSSDLGETDIDGANLDRWKTVGEQLGEDAHFFYDAASMTPNPYLGVLDPSRFILGAQGDLAAPGIDGVGQLFERVLNPLAVPLAVRVFDAFETLGSPTALMQGRININTAPDRVLRTLPFVDPRDPASNYAVPSIGAWTSAHGASRINMLKAYRDAYTGGQGVGDTPAAITNLPGLRANLAFVNNLTNRTRPGLDPFVSTGELAILGGWQVGLPEPDASAPGFLEMGAGGLSFDGEPLELRTRYADPTYNPTDDPEERLAIYRAISNIVSTRSDVFVMWFVIRGYEPTAIEAIPISGNPSEEQVGEALDQLRPGYESRWLCVLDRSGVQSPTDRPRVILLVELPTTSP